MNESENIKPFMTKGNLQESKQPKKFRGKATTMFFASNSSGMQITCEKCCGLSKKCLFVCPGK